MHFWLRKVTELESVYVSRHMKLEDPADPSQAAALVERIRQLRQRAEEDQERRRQVKKLLGKARHIALQIASTRTAKPEEEMQKLAETMVKASELGMPPSDPEFRKQLSLILDKLPEDLGSFPDVFCRAVDYAEEYQESLPEALEVEAGRVAPEVGRVARLLEGTTLLFIGGNNREGQRLALKHAFKLEEVTWADTRAHQSTTPLHVAVARPEVSLVVLAIRWSSHSFGDVAAFCKEHNKLLVRLSGGYHPNQVARQILDQCSDRLELIRTIPSVAK